MADKKQDSTKNLILALGGAGLLFVFGLVAAIIGLGSVTVVTMKDAEETHNEANATSMKIELRNIQAGLEYYYEDHDEYPTSLNDLKGDYVVSIVIDNQSPAYVRLSEDEYRLSITLPDGKVYTLSNS